MWKLRKKVQVEVSNNTVIMQYEWKTRSWGNKAQKARNLMTEASEKCLVNK